MSTTNVPMRSISLLEVSITRKISRQRRTVIRRNLNLVAPLKQLLPLRYPQLANVPVGHEGRLAGRYSYETKSRMTPDELHIVGGIACRRFREDRTESRHGNLDACIKSALPLPLVKCQYLALSPFSVPATGEAVAWDAVLALEQASA